MFSVLWYRILIIGRQVVGNCIQVGTYAYLSYTQFGHFRYILVDKCNAKRGRQIHIMRFVHRDRLCRLQRNCRGDRSARERSPHHRSTRRWAAAGNRSQARRVRHLGTRTPPHAAAARPPCCTRGRGRTVRRCTGRCI